MKTKQWLLAMSAVIMLAGCGDVFAPETDGKSTVQADGITLNETSLTLAIGETRTLTAEVSPGNAANNAVLWTSKAPGVVSVDADGVITAHAIGTAIIAAITKDGGKTAQCTVKVIPPISVIRVLLDITDLTLIEGDVEFLTAEIQPYNATNQNINWSSDNESVATVDDSGMVTAVSVGSAVITVTTEDGGRTATCAVTVEADDPFAIRVTGVALNKNSFTITAGEEETLTANITPSDATRQNVTWRSDNTTVARVDENGVVSALSAGIAVITVTTRNGGYTATCTVTVEAAPVGVVTGVTLNRSTLTLTGGTGSNNTATLTATVQPTDAINKNISWSSSNEGVATVNTSGLVTGVAPGNAVITVTTEESGYTATCAVTVNARPVTGITLNKSDIPNMMIGETITLIATITPAGATNKNVTWSSSDNGVATVDQNGVVTAIALGDVDITVRTQDGNREANCYFTVVPIHKKIKITNIAGLIDESNAVEIFLLNTLANGYNAPVAGVIDSGNRPLIPRDIDDDGSLTISLADSGSYWNGTGEYYIVLRMMRDYYTYYRYLYNHYIYTNGSTLASLGITGAANANNAPKLTINTQVTEIDASKFKHTREGSDKITITGLNGQNDKKVELKIGSSDYHHYSAIGFGTIANGTVTMLLYDGYASSSFTFGWDMFSSWTSGSGNFNLNFVRYNFSGDDNNYYYTDGKSPAQLNPSTFYDDFFSNVYTFTFTGTSTTIDVSKFTDIPNGWGD
jgi:uncharacterized protein YjdB